MQHIEACFSRRLDHWALESPYLGSCHSLQDSKLKMFSSSLALGKSPTSLVLLLIHTHVHMHMHIEERAKVETRKRCFGSSIPCSFWHIRLPCCQVKRETRWFDKWFLLLSNLPSLSAQIDSSYLFFLGRLEGLGKEGGEWEKENTLLSDSFCGRGDQWAPVSVSGKQC